ncbi:glutathione S-transferase family protein [Niveibacterium sp. SC-1]|uniref:glutathione S-transferase family protein n=1 Tax=Niveibacterium sp. SC-1 TaxID=3135646 RepID=UPI00311D96F0
MKVLGDIASGNCYKVKLVLAQLGIAHEWTHVAIGRGETRTAEFLRLNPNGKIPVLLLDNGEVLSESNAIINYLAEGSPLLPTDRLTRARVLEWQFFEQYSHEPYIAVARFINRYLGMPEHKRAEFESKQTGGLKALGVMEQQLGKTPFLVGEHYTIADVSLYAYTHVAHEGGFDLAAFPAVSTWVERVRQQPGHVTMEQFL